MRINLKFFFVSILLFTLVNCQVNHVLRPEKFADVKNENVLQKAKSEGTQNQESSPLLNFKDNDFSTQNFSVNNYFFTTEDGRKLNGWLLKSKTEIPKISVFALHGNSGNLSTQYQKFSELTNYGFQVFIFDYAGFGYSEGKSTRKNAVEDSFAAFDFFEKLAEIEGTSKIIYGQSIGGNFSIPVAAENQNRIEALIVEGTFTNFNDIANRKIPLLGGLFIKDNYDNQLNLKNFKKPILIVHSKDDRIIPLEMGKQLFEKANEPKEFFEIEHPHLKGTSFYAKEISEKIYKMIN